MKRSKRRAVLARWLEQAEAQARREGRPWLLVVAGHADRRPLAVLDFGLLVELTRRAGLTVGDEQLPLGAEEDAARAA